MILPPGTHCSRLSRNGSHMSTHTASIPFRWRLVNSVRKYSSSVSFLRSFPNHNGSAVSRLHTTVRNLSRFPWYSSSTDRKSTRLNSSHLGISYAVFCLKKKKKIHTRKNRRESKTMESQVYLRTRHE